MNADAGTNDGGFAGMLPGPVGGPPGQDGQVNLFALAHRLLRGRYMLAAILGGLGAVGGAALGYLSQSPLYQSEGSVRIQYMVTKIQFDTPENSNIPNFEAFVQAHASYLKQPRVLEKALGSEAWLSLGRPKVPAALTAFRNSLFVSTSAVDNERISVVFSDKDPRAAKIGLQEVLSAYEDLYAIGETRRKREQTLRLHEEKRRSLAQTLVELRSRIQEESKEFGTDDLGPILSKRYETQNTLDAKVLEQEMRLADRGLAPGARPEGPAPDAAPPGLTPQEIAIVDDKMRKLLEERALQESYLTELKGHLTAQHRTVKQAEQALAAKNAVIQKYADDWNKADKGVFAPGPGSPADSVAKLQDRLNIYKKQADQWKADTAPIARKKVILDSLRREFQEAETQALDVKRRIDSINTEAKGQEVNGGRIEISEPSDIPSIPTTDRRKKFGLMGLILGGGIPVGLIALIGLFDGRRRFTHSDQARDTSSSLPLLGILPMLPKDLSDPEQSAAAAHCVHQMRTLLQIGGDRRKVYAVTSSTAGDGKTSLTLSLGLSFAAAGSRTLLADFDLIGHGLSSSLKVRPEQGIAEVLRTGDFAGSVVPTGSERLSLIPAGRNDDRFVSRLSEPMVRAFIDSLREQYDVLLIDTGPILGSLEANFVCAAADGVVLVVGRGQQRAHVQRAVEQLGRLRARVLGMVFNRADSADFMQSATSASFRSVRDDPTPPRDSSEPAPDLEPVARTVAMDVRR